MPTKMVGIRMPVDLAEELNRVATGKGETMTSFVRRLIDEALFPSLVKQLNNSANQEVISLADIDKRITHIESTREEDYVQNSDDHDGLKKSVADINLVVESVKQQISNLADSCVRAYGSLGDVNQKLDERISLLENNIEKICQRLDAFEVLVKEVEEVESLHQPTHPDEPDQVNNQKEKLKANRTLINIGDRTISVFEPGK